MTDAARGRPGTKKDLMVLPLWGRGLGMASISINILRDTKVVFPWLVKRLTPKNGIMNILIIRNLFCETRQLGRRQKEVGEDFPFSSTYSLYIYIIWLRLLPETQWSRGNNETSPEKLYKLWNLKMYSYISSIQQFATCVLHFDVPNKLFCNLINGLYFCHFFPLWNFTLQLLRCWALTQTSVLIVLSHSFMSDEHTVLLLWACGPWRWL